MSGTSKRGVTKYVIATDSEGKAIKLGSGSYGCVFKGFKISNPEELVAIKVFENSTDGVSEASVLLSIQDEHVIKILDLGILTDGPEKGKYVLVLEFCNQGSLNLFMKQRGYDRGLDDHTFLRLVECLKNGYKYLQDRNLLHRDIKPANVLVSEDKYGKLWFKLADFGTAREVKYGDRLTAGDVAVGSMFYWHPRVNQMAKKDGNDVVSTTSDKTYIDLWSIGTTLYEAATNEKAIQLIPGKIRNLKNTLQQAYSVMDKGTICLKESEDGNWIQLKELPENILMSRNLANKVAPFIANLMSKERNTEKSIIESLSTIIEIPATESSNDTKTENITEPNTLDVSTVKDADQTMQQSPK